MRSKKEQCEVCEQYRVLTRYGICKRCYEAQNNSYITLPQIHWGKSYSVSHTLDDLQKAPPKDTFGLYSGGTK